MDSIYNESLSRGFIVYQAGSSTVNIRSLSFSGTTVTFNTDTETVASNAYDAGIAGDNNNGFVITWYNTLQLQSYAKAGIFATNNSISMGSDTALVNDGVGYYSRGRIVYCETPDRYVSVVQNYEGRLVLSIITRSGTSSTQAGTYTLNDSPTGGHTAIGLSWNEDQQRIYVVWRNSSGYATVQAATFNGAYTSFTVGTATVVLSTTTENQYALYKLAYSPDTAETFFPITLSGSSTTPKYVILTGTGPTVSSATNMYSETTIGYVSPTVGETGSGRIYMAIFGTGTNGVLTANNGYAATYFGPVSNFADFVGITDQAIADTATGAVVVEGGVTEKVSSLTTGSTYYVKDDGTLSTTSSSVTAGKAIATDKLLLKG